MPTLAGMEDREGVRWPREVVVSVVCIAGLAVCSGALVVLVPMLFRPQGQVEVWVLVVLAVLAAIFAIKGRSWRRAASPPRRR